MKIKAKFLIYLFLTLFLSSCAQPPLKFPYHTDVAKLSKTAIDGVWQYETPHPFKPLVKVDSGLMYLMTVGQGASVQPGMVMAKNIREVKFPLYKCEAVSYKKGTTFWSFGEAEIEVLSSSVFILRLFPNQVTGLSFVSTTYKNINLDNKELLINKFESPEMADRENTQIPKKVIKSGTGFAVSPDGLIVTAYHIIGNATNIELRGCAKITSQSLAGISQL